MGTGRPAEVGVSELEAPPGRVPELAYLRVADDIAARIGSGELTAKTRLRAERELTGHYGVAYGTIRRAMKELRARGLVLSVPGRGTFVTAKGGPS
jgi:DNA-binding GntR family transcriptional regulator